MKSLITQLASIKINLDEDIVIIVLLKSLLDEDYLDVITTLTNVPNTSPIEVEVALLAEESKIKAKEVQFMWETRTHWKWLLYKEKTHIVQENEYKGEAVDDYWWGKLCSLWQEPCVLD